MRHDAEVPFRLLHDVLELACGDADSGDLIVEGDNLLALKALLPHYGGQVKCIHIDPPYNTGNEGWLLGNCLLHVERAHICKAMTRWLVRSKQPVIVIDWSDLKSDRSWHLLRAAIPVGGRSLPILDMVFPGGKQGSPKAEKLFLKRLAYVVPDDVRPVLVTDAGFRGPWFQAVEAMGWQWLGRLRNRTYLKPVEVPDEPGQWVTCKATYALATREPRLSQGSRLRFRCHDNRPSVNGRV